MLSEDFEEGYIELKNSFGAKLKDRIAEINNMEGILFNQNTNIDIYTEFYKIIHKITGSSGMFGFDKVSETSNDLELILKRIINTNSIPDEEENERIKIFINLLKEAIESI